MKIFLKVSYVETFYEEFIELSSFPLSVGRDPESSIALMGHDVSRKHAEIVEKDGEVFLRDLGSRTKIWHQGKALSEIKIEEGLQLRIGSAILKFSFVRFPLEQTVSIGHAEETVHHEPLSQRLESIFTARLPIILFFVLAALAFFTAPDFYRKGDASKNLAFLVLTRSLLAPFIISLIIVFIRKLNRGDYAWHRSLCMGYILFIFAQLVELLEGSLCWFSSFAFVWNSIVFSILSTSLLFLWWLVAVGKSASFKSRYLRALGISVLAYVLIVGICRTVRRRGGEGRRPRPASTPA